MLSKLRRIDWILVLTIGLLTLVGIVAIYTITFPTVGFALARSQLLFASLGIVIAVLVTLTDYRSLSSLSYFLYTVGIVLLIAVFFIGSKQFGAARWIDLGFTQLQPSELMKLFLIITLARLFSWWHDSLSLQRLGIILFVAALPTVMVFAQPDLGTASVLGVITLGFLIFGRLPWRWWAGLIGIALISLPLFYASLQPYQKNRIKTFVSPSHDVQGEGYNVRQAAIAIGSGGMFGQGLGQGSQSQLNFLPVAHTDFIFAGLAEATGLMGSFILLVLYFVLFFRIYRLAEVAKDMFGTYLALGIVIMLSFQVVVNIGMNIGLLPVTGIPLPYVSYGGTALLLNFLSLGILQSIYIRHKKITF